MVRGRPARARAPGRVDAVTVLERDALGRVIQVTEPDPVTGAPSPDTTSYAYNVLDKLVQVNQGAQVRTFHYSAFGFLEDETTPEAGAAGKARTDYPSYGSLGNLLVKRDGAPSATQYNYTYDSAGRLTLLTTGTSSFTTYLVQCFDGTGICGDTTVPNFSGGSYPKGRLTRRLGWNLIPFPAASVYDDFAYSGSSGRLSARTTSIGARGGLLTAAGFGAPVTQTWTYNSQGRMASHTQPRAAGASSSLTVNDADYSSGSLTRVTASWQGGGSQQLVAANYHESGRLADYSTGSTGTVKTTISPDGLIPSRPGQISVNTGAFATGAFAYDGAGNIKSMGSSDTFSYDARSRITQAKYGSTTQIFMYDRYGNLLTRAGTTLCTGTCANNRIAGAVHDDRGNMTTLGSETLAYDLLNRQIAETNASSDFAYLYDGAGERVGKFPRSGGVLRRELAHDVIEARGDASLACTANPFLDVLCASNPNDGKYIQKLKDVGITSGCGGGSFCPDTTVARDQASVFLVLGKHCPVGVNGCTWTPPACTGRFADVPCPSTYAAWIEQLSSDGVTSGCGGGKFCPSAPLTPWQMLAWLKVYWPGYNPVPRGTILTFRDEDGKVTTEAHQASATGDASDSIVYERDNVFLGHQLVASAIWNGTTPGWQFYSSDHLGTPRLTTNNTGATVETRKYWPYGDEASSSGNATQRLKFASMERDDEANHFYDHARSHDFNLGRFTSPDKVGGHVTDPQTWNRYTYALNNPLKVVDQNGKWPTKVWTVHQNAIKRALPDIPRTDRDLLMTEQRIVDKDQRAESQFKHAMRGPNQSVEDAKARANRFVHDNLVQAIALERTGDHHSALVHVADAMHTLQDSTSPAHEGFQSYGGGGTAEAVEHAAEELRDPGAGSQLDVITRQAWDYFTGAQPLPRDFFPDVGTQKAPECGDSNFVGPCHN